MIPDWLRWRRHDQRVVRHDLDQARYERARAARAREFLTTDVFRETCHAELDDLVDMWLTTRDSAEAASLHVRARELQALIIRMQSMSAAHEAAGLKTTKGV